MKLDSKGYLSHDSWIKEEKMSILLDDEIYLKRFQRLLFLAFLFLCFMLDNYKDKLKLNSDKHNLSVQINSANIFSSNY